MSWRLRDEAACKSCVLAACTDADGGLELGRPSVDGIVVVMSCTIGPCYLEVG